MSRILKRPMFKTGGSTNEGIMHGLVDRRRYLDGAFGTTAKQTAGDVYDFMKEMVPGPQARFPLGQIGLNLVSGEYAGDGFLSNVARSVKGPYSEWTKADDARADYDRQLRMAAAQTGIKHAMEGMGGSKMSTYARQAREAMADSSIINPSTGEPFKSYGEAYTFYSTSQGDISRASIEEKIYNRSRIFYQGDPDGELKATYDVTVEPKLKRIVGEESVGGKLPKGELARKKKLKRSQKGTYFFDLGRTPPQVVRYDGIDENGNPLLATLDQDTFTPKEVRSEPRTNLEPKAEVFPSGLDDPYMA